MARSKVRFLGRNDQLVACVIVVFFLIGGSFYFWQRAITNRGIIDFEDMPLRHAVYMVDVNRAAWPEFANLPGIGESLAKQIVEHRKQNGPFRTKAALQEVSGIGPAKLNSMIPHVFIRERTERESVGLGLPRQ